MVRDSAFDPAVDAYRAILESLRFMRHWA